jgi:nucleoside 2-deoxyribosyltransferase
MKNVSTNDGITDRILAEIRRAEFVVADFTGQRGGVYFEAGFARGLGRPVIWCVQKDELNMVHFDIKHFGHVVWESPADFRQKLTDSILANVIRSA